MVENMLITDLWKSRMKETLQMIYGNKLREEGLNKLLDNEIKRSMGEGTRYMYLRDIYRNRVIKMDLNETLMWIHKNDYIIGANGAFSYNPDIKLGDTTIMVLGDLDSRTAEKKLAKEFEKNNMIKEATLHDNLQTKFKQDTNSTYGIACMVGSFLFSPDSATYITKQARELISEVMWSFERLLVNNLQLTSYNEALLFINNILKIKRNYNDFKQYISYIPNTKEITKYVLSKFADIVDFNNKTKNISRSLFLFLESLSEEDRVYLYYRSNFQGLIEHNPTVMKLFKDILNIETDFLDPNKVPEDYIAQCKLLVSLTEEFCYFDFMTSNRVDKYFNSYRDNVLLSDTDSVFVILDKLMNIIYSKVGFMYKYKSNDYKLINSLCYMCTHYMKMRHRKLLDACNAHDVFPNYTLEAKNEFYYKRIIIYKGIKKNYSGLKLLREGNIVPPAKQISHTGIKLTGSKIPKQVGDFQTQLLEERILRSEFVDPVHIINDINIEKDFIKTAIRNGDKSFGIPQRFSGYDKYKNFNSTQICRLVEIWNRLYPDKRVGSGEYLMTFETKVYNESYLYLIKDEKMREKIKQAIFSQRYEGEDNFLRSVGIKTIGIPKDTSITHIPSWAIDIIDADLMARKHLQPIIDLFPSLNMNKVKTKDFNTYSSLIKI